MIHDSNRQKYDKKKLRRNFYGSDDEIMVRVKNNVADDLHKCFE